LRALGGHRLTSKARGRSFLAGVGALYGQMDWWEGGRNRGPPAIPSRHTAVTAGNVTKRNAEIGYASVVPGVSWYRVSCIVVSWSGQTLKRKGAGPTTRCGDCGTPKLTSISASLTPSSGPKPFPCTLHRPPRPIPAPCTGLPALSLHPAQASPPYPCLSQLAVAVTQSQRGVLPCNSSVTPDLTPARACSFPSPTPRLHTSCPAPWLLLADCYPDRA
jgi:hypothetical protein